MKNFTSYLFMLGAAALILSSCGTSSDLSSSSAIQKRRYTKGYHLNIPGKYKDKLQQATASEVAPQQPLLVTTQETPEIETNVVASANEAIDFEPKASPNFTKTTMTLENDSPKPVESDAYTKAAKKMEKKIAKKFNAKNTSSTTVAPITKAPPAASGDMILYIILAILIPPLAVGLLYGITGKFWISLLLTLLFYIPGMIYSLIVVLQY